MLLARYTNWNRPCSALWRRLRLQRVKMRTDAINMEANEGLLAFVDFREKLSSDPNIRWTDRVYPDGMWEPNLYQFYRLVQRYEF